MVNALPTTAVEAKAILPAIVVVNMPVGINVIVPPPNDMGLGAVIVSMGVTPDIKVIALVGAIVVADAIVGAAAEVALTP